MRLRYVSKKWGSNRQDMRFIDTTPVDASAGNNGQHILATWKFTRMKTASSLWTLLNDAWRKYCNHFSYWLKILKCLSDILSSFRWSKNRLRKKKKQRKTIFQCITIHRNWSFYEKKRSMFDTLALPLSSIFTSGFG